MSAPYTIYFAGELFSLKHLVGNALLADAISRLSKNTYRCILPQDLEQRETTATAIRNQDLYYCMSCDLGIFHFDGPELDSGTAAEFLYAKMLDIPAVILRSDFRQSGDAKSVPWNLMLAGYPRTELVLLDSVLLYKQSTARQLGSSEAALAATEELAQLTITALDTVRSTPPILQPAQRDAIYEWARTFPGSGFDSKVSREELLKVLKAKVEKGLL